MSIVPPSQGLPNTPFTGHYFSVAASPILYGPLLADPWMTVMDVEVDLDPQLPEEVSE
jgi:hypothetical protein